LRRYERVIARVLLAADPVAALAEATRRTRDAALREQLRAVDADGLRLSALLVARLRFERLVRGSGAAAAWFDRDPAGFAAYFRAYHAEVPPRAFTPAAEAADFLRFVGA
jgi:hypothetical protein